MFKLSVSTKKYFVPLRKHCACAHVIFISGCSSTRIACSKPKSGVSIALQEYLFLAKKYYSAEPQSVDFVGAADAIRRDINSSVEQQTEGEFQPPLSKSKRSNFGFSVPKGPMAAKQFTSEW